MFAHVIVGGSVHTKKTHHVVSFDHTRGHTGIPKWELTFTNTLPGASAPVLIARARRSFAAAPNRLARGSITNALPGAPALLLVARADRSVAAALHRLARGSPEDRTGLLRTDPSRLDARAARVVAALEALVAVAVFRRVAEIVAGLAPRALIVRVARHLGARSAGLDAGAARVVAALEARKAVTGRGTALRAYTTARAHLARFSRRLPPVWIQVI